MEVGLGGRYILRPLSGAFWNNTPRFHIKLYVVSYICPTSHLGCPDFFIGTEIKPIEPARVIPGREMSARLPNCKHFIRLATHRVVRRIPDAWIFSLKNFTR